MTDSMPEQGFFLTGSLRGISQREEGAAYADVHILPDGFYNSVRVQVKARDNVSFGFLSQLAPGTVVTVALSSPRIIPAKIRQDGSQQAAFLGGHLILGACVAATALAAVA